MKARVVAVAVLVLLLASSSLALAGSQPEGQAIATGQVHFTRYSVCEHPSLPGVFLQYYLTDGCGHELFLYARLSSQAVGSTIWAQGGLVQNGSCQILNVNSFALCQPPEP
jgi:hypothetical protein